MIALWVKLFNGEILTNLHESNAIPVADIIEVLEEALFLFIGLVVVSVLLHALFGHVFADGIGFIHGGVIELVWVNEELTKRMVLAASLVDFVQVFFEDGVAGLRTFPEAIDDTTLTAGEGYRVICILSVFVLEYFIFNQVFIVFMRFDYMAGLHEVVVLYVEVGVHRYQTGVLPCASQKVSVYQTTG